MGAFNDSRRRALGGNTQALAAAIENAAGRNAEPVPKRSRRRFDGAVFNRLTSSWNAVNYAIDAELQTDLDALRGRSRDLFKNNGYAKRFSRLVQINAVGPEGFRLQAKSLDPSGELDKFANKAIERGFTRWSRPGECDVAGKRSFVDICRGAINSAARDGEYLIRRIRNAGTFGYQLQPLNVDRLDTFYNVMPANGRNAIIMGVEVNQGGKPVAYHLWNRHPTVSPDIATRYRERIPANEIFHGFIPLEDEQTRGVPWMHAAMRRSNDLNGYREAAIIAARVGASKMGFFTAPDGDPTVLSDPSDPDGASDEDSKGFTKTAEPGTFDVVPDGYKFDTYNPDYPHDQFDAFCKSTLREIASAIGTTYHSLANDLEGVSFSSIRSGTLEERDEWMTIQNWLINALLIPIFEDWLEMALLRGAILLPNGSALPFKKIDKFRDHKWQGRRWQWVDPLKDISASVMAIENGLDSPQHVAAQTGRDIEEVLDEVARYQQAIRDKGIVLTGTTAATGVAAGGANAESKPAPAQ